MASLAPEGLYDIFRDLLVLEVIIHEQLVHVVAVVEHFPYAEVEHTHA